MSQKNKIFLGVVVGLLILSGAIWGITKKTTTAESDRASSVSTTTRDADPTSGRQGGGLDAGSRPSQLAPSQDEDRRTFQILARDTLKALPSIEQLRATIHNDEEAHHTPPALMEAGRKLGAVAQRLASNPDLRLEALDFYKECVLDSKLVESIRALCLGDFKMHHHDGDRVQLDESEIPQRIQDLASKLGG